MEEREADEGGPPQLNMTDPCPANLEVKELTTSGSASGTLPVVDVVTCCLKHSDSTTHECVDMYVDNHLAHQMQLVPELETPAA